LRQETLDFIGVIKSSCENLTTNRWSRKYNQDKIRNYLISDISKTSLANIISDPFWNKYPTYCYRNNCDVIYSFSDAIRIAINDILLLNKENCTDIFISKSVGLIALYTTDMLYGPKKLKIAKRGIKLSDSRVRKLSARIVPISFLEKYAGKERNASVRRVMFTRLGSYGVSKSIIKDMMKNNTKVFSSSYYQNQLLFKTVASLDKDFIKEFLDFCQEADVFSSVPSWVFTPIVNSFFQQCSNTDVLFNQDSFSSMNSLSEGQRISKIISKRISSI